MPLAGGTFTGDVVFSGAGTNITFDQSTDDFVFNDGAKAVFGTGLDFEIFFDGSHARLNTEGNFNVQSDVISFTNKANTEVLADFTANNSVDLYYANSKRFETLNIGANVTGNLGVNSTNPKAFTHASDGVTTTIFEAVASDASASTFETACFRGGNDGNGAAARVRICHDGDRGLVIDGGRDSNAAFGKISLTDQNGGITQSVHINNTGTWYWGKTGQSSSTPGVELGIDYPNFMTRNGTTVLGLNNQSGTTGDIMRFYYQDVHRGNLNYNGTSFAATTASDYRLKENDTPITDSIERLKKLRPVKFNWKKDPTKVYDGFIAHEVQEIVPDCVIGEKDAPINKKGEGYQHISKEGLIPLLTAAVKECITEIENIKLQLQQL
jgi:hypothetical protein